MKAELDGWKNCLKLLFFLFLGLVSLSAYSQNSYIEIEAGDSSMFIQENYYVYLDSSSMFLETGCMGVKDLLPPYVLRSNVKDGIYKIICNKNPDTEKYWTIEIKDGKYDGLFEYYEKFSYVNEKPQVYRIQGKVKHLQDQQLPEKILISSIYSYYPIKSRADKIVDTKEEGALSCTSPYIAIGKWKVRSTSKISIFRRNRTSTYSLKKTFYLSGGYCY